MNWPLVAVLTLAGMVVILVSLHVNNHEDNHPWTKVGSVVVLLLFQPVKLAIKIFTKLGADMSAVDEAIARFTAFTQGVLADLQEARTQIQELIDTDAVEDAAQAEALQNEIAGKIDTAIATLQNPPSAPVEEEPEPTPEPEPEAPVEETPAPETSPGTVEEPPTQ